MLHVTPDYVRDLQLKHNLVFWKICDKTKKAVINRNQTNNLSASIDELQNALNIAGDYVVVTLYNQEPKETKTGDTRALSFEVAVKLNQGYNNTNQINGAPIDLILKYQEEKHAAHLENERLKLLQANQPKKHWIAELAAENPELLNGAISSAKILGGKLIDFMSTKTNKGISAPEQINNEIAEVLNKFKKIDPHYFEVLKRMANMCEEMPIMYWKTKKDLYFDVPEEKLK